MNSESIPILRFAVQERRRLSEKSDTSQPNYTDDFWPIDGVYHPLVSASYEGRFKNLLPENSTFTGLINARKKAGLPTNILDLFGSGFFVHDYENVDSLVGVRLKDVPRTVKINNLITDLMVINETLTQEEVDEFRRIQKSKYLNQLDREKRSTIETDIYHPSSIRKVKNHMKVKEISSFDLIVCKPAGPFAALKRNAINLPGLQSLFTNLLNKYYELLSNQEGMMFLQLPVGIFKSEEVKSWVENNKNESLKIEFDEEKKALKIVKLYGAPENLNFVSMAA